jgi:hypothetical protein
LSLEKTSPCWQRPVGILLALFYMVGQRWVRLVIGMLGKLKRSFWLPKKLRVKHVKQYLKEIRSVVFALQHKILTTDWKISPLIQTFSPLFLHPPLGKQ